MIIRDLRFFSRFTKVRNPVLRLPKRITAPHFELQRMSVACPNCGWQGTGAELSLGEMHDGGCVSDYNCPSCHEWIAVAKWPTPSECRDNWNELSAAEREYVSLLEELAETAVSKPSRTNRPVMRRE
jgi:predicted RNA-binding Zn-ribbon protein involved in translation (DUF1610 family)